MKKPIKNSILCAIASLTLLLAGTASVRADLIAYEGFGYSTTTNAGSGSSLTNGYGWAKGSYWTRENSKDILAIATGSLTYGNVVTTSNRFELAGSLGRYSNRSFAASIDAAVSDVVWGGILMKTPSSKTDRTARFKLNNSGTAQFYVFADGSASIVVGGGSATQIDTGIAPGTGTRFYLYKIDLVGTDPVAQLWISPSNFSSEAALGTPSVTITNVCDVFSSFSLGASGGNPAPYDEIRIGTTLEDAWLTLPPVPPLATVIVVR